MCAFPAFTGRWPKPERSSSPCAAFTVPTGEAHWHVLLRARAIETGCFVIAAAQAGTHANGRRTYGHSMIIDPWGRIIAEADGETVGPVFADIDLAAIDEARGKVPALHNARDFALPSAPEAERQAS